VKVRPCKRLTTFALELFITHFMVDERHSFAVCCVTTAFGVENKLPTLANALTALSANGMVILALLVHYQDLHQDNPSPLHAKASSLEHVPCENHVEKFKVYCGGYSVDGFDCFNELSW
jgi:hypothetical protein